jgi:hypothetical protein
MTASCSSSVATEREIAGDGLAALDALCQDPSGKLLHTLSSFGRRRAVGHDATQIDDIGDPATVRFLLYFDGERHASNPSVSVYDIYYAENETGAAWSGPTHNSPGSAGPGMGSDHRAAVPRHRPETRRETRCPKATRVSVTEGL